MAHTDGSYFTAEDNMNVQLENINVTQRDGRVTHLDRVYIRGSHVRLFIVPDMLRYGSHNALGKMLLGAGV
jgi:small nuclear ribonucleoprotein D3